MGLKVSTSSPRTEERVVDKHYRHHRRVSQAQENDTEEETSRIKERKGKREMRSRDWRDKGEIKRVNHEVEIHIGDQLAENCSMYQDDITSIKWNAEAALENVLIGDKFVKPKILLISSNIRKGAHVMQHVIKRDKSIIPVIYDFQNTTFEDLLQTITESLKEYKDGCRAETISFYCQGGPGHVYLLKKRVLTWQRLSKPTEQDMINFFKELGKCVTKNPPESATIYFMGCHLLGNDNGKKLLKTLEKLIKPNKASFQAPLEFTADGSKMICTYFEPKRYKFWKQQQCSSMEVIEWPADLQ